MGTGYKRGGRLGADIHLGKDIREGRLHSQDRRGVGRSQGNCLVGQIKLENEKQGTHF